MAGKIIMDALLYAGIVGVYLSYWHIRLRLSLKCVERCLTCQTMLGEVLYLKTASVMYSAQPTTEYGADITHIVGWLNTLRGEMPDASMGIIKTWQHVKTFKASQRLIREEYADYLSTGDF